MPMFADWDREEERLTLTFPDGTSVSGSAEALGDAFE